MADLSDFELIDFSGLPTVNPTGAGYLMLDNGATTGKNTINDIVAAAQATQDNAAAIAVNTSDIADHAADLNNLNTNAILRLGVLPSGSVADVFANGVYALSSSVSYTGLPTGVSSGTLLSLKPQRTTNYYAVHILVSPSGNVYVQIYSTTWSSWKQLATV